MIKFARSTPSLIRNLKYTFIPPSCYDIQTKPNPVVCVTLGNDSGAFCDLHFRVSKLLCSSSKMLSLKLHKIISNCCWAMLLSKTGNYPLWELLLASIFSAASSNLVAVQIQTAQFLVPNSETNLSNYCMTALGF
jgi:hypothetical protein